MTKKNDNTNVEEILAAICALNIDGVQHPSVEDIERKMKELKKQKARELKKQKEATKKAKATKKTTKKTTVKKGNIKPDDLVVVKFDDGEIVCESQETLDSKRVVELLREVDKWMDGYKPRDVPFTNRWYVGGTFNTATDEGLWTRLLNASGLSATWVRRVQELRRTINFVENIYEVVKMAQKKNFKLGWYHILKALETKNNDLCIYWLKVAINERMSFDDLARAIANNGDRKVVGRTRKESFIKAVKENVETHNNLVDKYPKISRAKEDLEPADMPLIDFFSQLFTVVDTGYFNIQTNQQD